MHALVRSVRDAGGHNEAYKPAYEPGPQCRGAVQGQMTEWLKVPALKAGTRKVSWVRILLCPLCCEARKYEA